MTRFTPLGAMLATAGLASILAALVAGTLAPALGGAALWGMLAWVRAQATHPELEVRREIPTRIAAGQPFQVRVVVTAHSSQPLVVEDVVPAGVQAQGASRTVGRGEASFTYSAVAAAPGRIAWRSVRVHARDAWGIWDVDEAVPVTSRAHVHPEPAWAVRARRAGRRHRVQTVVRAPRGAEPQVEVERVREWRPGDRVRDIDWKRGSLMQGLWTRERERGMPRPVTVLLDASRSMRAPGRLSRLETASRVALGVAAAAEAAGVSAGIVAFHEEGVEHDPDLGAPRGARGVLGHLAALPPVQAAARQEAESTATLEPQEQAFMQKAAQVRPGPSSIAWQAALSLLLARSGTPGMVVAVLDVEHHMRRSLAMVRRLRARGLAVVAVTVPTGPHLHRRGAVDARAEADLAAWLTQRMQFAHEAAGMQVPLLVAHPDSVDDVVAEVIRSAR